MSKPSEPPLRARRQLPNSMEHIRYAVTHVPSNLAAADAAASLKDDPEPPAATSEVADKEAADKTSSYPDPSTTYGVPQSFEPPRHSTTSIPPSSDTSSSSFQFGTRYLLPNSDIFSHNAWDHVSPDASYAAFASSQYAAQRASPATPFDRARFNARPAKFWDLFYGNNKANFFKDRRWLAAEFPVLAQLAAEDSPPALLLEVGAGAGNTAFPVLKMSRNAGLRVVACDFSRKAVELMRGHEACDGAKLRAEVWDCAGEGLSPGVEPGSVDVATMIFVFSALAPEQWAAAVRNVFEALKPGGVVLFRDYGRGDLAQVRFRKGRWMGENFYVRGDGTRVYFFEKEELRDIWTGGAARLGRKSGDAGEDEVAAGVEKLGLGEDAGKRDVTGTEGVEQEDGVEDRQQAERSPAFEVVQLGVDRRMLVNRQRQLKMYRCWMQAVFRKPDPSGMAATAAADIPLADIENLPADGEQQEDPEAGATAPPG